MSLIDGVSNAWNAATVSGLGRSISVRMRNPGAGCISADFGFPTIASPRCSSGPDRVPASIGNSRCLRQDRSQLYRCAGPDDNVGGPWVSRCSRGDSAMRVILLARFASPYPGSFVAMVRAVAAECDRRGWEFEPVFEAAARDRPWFADLGREMRVRTGP